MIRIPLNDPLIRSRVHHLVEVVGVDERRRGLFFVVIVVIREGLVDDVRAVFLKRGVCPDLTLAHSGSPFRWPN